MVKFTDLGLKEVSYTNNENKTEKLIIIPVITLNDEAFSKANNDNKKARIWKKFKTTISKKIEYDENIKLNHEDEREPFKDLEDDQYFFTNLLSLTALKENERKDLNIGLRYLTENDDSSVNVHVFSDSFIKDLDSEQVTENIEFDNLETTYEEIATAIRNESKKNVAEIEERERIEKEEKEAKEREAEQNAQVDAPESNEDASYDNDDVVDNPRDLAYDDDGYNNDNYDDYEEDVPEPRSDIDELKDELFVAIDNLIPKVHLDNVDVDYSETQYDTNERYGELERIALNAIGKTQNDKLALLETKREDIVNKIYQDAVNDLWKYYLENNKLLNYESDESEYHQEYRKIQDSYNRVADSAETQRQNEEKRLTDNFEADKERQAKQAYEETKARIEREGRHLIEEDSYRFKDDLLNNANDEYRQQIETLESDIANVHQTRMYEIVDKVVNDHTYEIDSHAKEVDATRQQTEAEINAKHEKEMQKLQETIKAYEVENLKQKQNFDDEVNLKVNEKVSNIQKENDELRHKMELLESKYEASQTRIKDNEETIKNQEIERRHEKSRMEMAEKEAKLYRDKYEKQIQDTFGAYNENIQRTREYSNAVTESKYPNFNQVVAPSNQGVGNTSVNDGTEKVASHNNSQAIAQAPRMKNDQDPETYHGRHESTLTDTYDNSYDKDVAMGRNIAIGSVLSAVVVGSGVIGSSLYHEQQNDDRNAHLKSAIEKSNKDSKLDDAKHLDVGDETTIDTRKKDSDPQKLQSAKVIDNSNGHIIVKTPDGKKWKLK